MKGSGRLNGPCYAISVLQMQIFLKTKKRDYTRVYIIRNFDFGVCPICNIRPLTWMVWITRKRAFLFEQFAKPSKLQLNAVYFCY